MSLLWPTIDVVSVTGFIAALWWFRDSITHIERQIFIALVCIGVAIFIPEYASGIWRALGITFLWEYGIVGGFFALIFGLVGIGKLVQILRGWEPKEK